MIFLVMTTLEMKLFGIITPPQERNWTLEIGMISFIDIPKRIIIFSIQFENHIHYPPQKNKKKRRKIWNEEKKKTKRKKERKGGEKEREE